MGIILNHYRRTQGKISPYNKNSKINFWDRLTVLNVLIHREMPTQLSSYVKAEFVVILLNYNILDTILNAFLRDISG